MIDTHCHLFKEYYENIEEVLFNMVDHIIIVSGTDKKNNDEVIDLCNNNLNIYGTIGFHPEIVDEIEENYIQYLESRINNNKIVAIGEIGLDYYYTKDNKEKQKELFINQILLAKKYNKPIVVHSRDASQDTYDILKNYAEGLKIDIHCFSGSVEMAKQYVELGCRLGIGGVVTFKNSKTLVDVVKEIDIEHLLLETDSPFLTPEPNRGKKNQPYNVLHVAQKIAEIKGMSLEDVLNITTASAIDQFDLPIELC